MYKKTLITELWWASISAATARVLVDGRTTKPLHKHFFHLKRAYIAWFFCIKFWWQVRHETVDRCRWTWYDADNALLDFFLGTSGMVSVRCHLIDGTLDACQRISRLCSQSSRSLMKQTTARGYTAMALAYVDRSTCFYHSACVARIWLRYSKWVIAQKHSAIK